MRRPIILVVLLALAALSPAQDFEPRILATTEQTKSLAASFLNTLATGTTYDAFGLMKAAAPAWQNEIDETRDHTMVMLDNIRATYGKPVGYDLLAERTLGNCIIRYEALLKLERQPIRCTIMFYRATNAWMPIRVTFDEDIDLLFAELGR